MVSYVVDSDNEDKLRIYVDGVERFSASGTNRSGRPVIDVGAAGMHSIEIAYDKDESVDSGSDDARIVAIEAVSQSSQVELGGFEYADLGAAPGAWTVGPHATNGLTWQVVNALPPRIYLNPVAGVSPPEVDGIIGNDLVSFSRVKLPNYAAHGAPKGEAVLETLENDRYFIGLRVPRSSVGEGQLDLVLDTSPLLTGAAAGCGPSGTSPDSGDRRFELVFDSALGSPASIVQWQGACTTSEPWEVVTSSAEWLVEAIAAEPPDDPQFMHVEMTLVPPLAETLSSLGLGMMWTSPGAVLQIPRAEGAPPNVGDASMGPC